MEKSKEKYEVILNYGTDFANVVLSTVLVVFKEMHDKHPSHSFGFIGERRWRVVTQKKSYRVTRKESYSQSKRYLTYYKMCVNTVAPDSFDMYTDVDKAAILLVNKFVGDQKEYVNNITRMMTLNFENF